MATTMSNDLPDDVVIDNISWLLVKPLMRFQCVCKSWYATITHPSFITTHLNRASSFSSHTADTFLQLINFRQKTWCLYSDHLELELPFQYPPIEFLLAGSVNGLICLFDPFSLNLYLWNPFIQKSKTLPSSSSFASEPSIGIYRIYRLGYHHRTSNYKVVGLRHYAIPQVYTLSTDSWRRIEAVVPGFLSEQTRNGHNEWRGDCKNSFVVAKDDAPIVDITWPPSHSRAIYSSLTVRGENLEELRPYLESGKLKAVIDPTGPYNFTDVIEAFRYLETGKARGEVVISPFPLQHLPSSILCESNNNLPPEMVSLKMPVH